eukprot:GHVO01048959.1.p1 GENE.GHVO01048959.1~~GHVO01048959.1.p1  ORF type:complete len:712 (+),score=68.67 GHVO01048959.1:107-2242(+)
MSLDGRGARFVALAPKVRDNLSVYQAEVDALDSLLKSENRGQEHVAAITKAYNTLRICLGGVAPPEIRIRVDRAIAMQNQPEPSSKKSIDKTSSSIEEVSTSSRKSSSSSKRAALAAEAAAMRVRLDRFQEISKAQAELKRVEMETELRATEASLKALESDENHSRTSAIDALLQDNELDQDDIEQVDLDVVAKVFSAQQTEEEQAKRLAAQQAQEQEMKILAAQERQAKRIAAQQAEQQEARRLADQRAKEQESLRLKKQEQHAKEDTLKQLTKEQQDQFQYCVQCGNRMTKKAKFCSSCGVATRTANAQQEGGMEVLIDTLELPRSVIPSFEGEPFEFREFVLAFDAAVGRKAVSNQLKLQHLLQHTKGRAFSSIRQCLLMDSEIGYPTARKILRERFGDPFQLANSCLQAIFEVPPVKQGDCRQLQSFSDQINSCILTLKSLGKLSEINSQEMIVKVLGKLPFFLQNRWRSEAVDVRRKTGTYPDFFEFARFVEKAANEINDPVYGIKTTAEPRANSKKHEKRVTHSVTTQSVAPPQQQKSDATCPVCGQGGHRTEKCRLLVAADLPERKKLISTKGLCFGCLGRGHISKNCRSRMKCEVCQRRHPTMLHIYQTNDQVSEQTTSAAIGTSLHVSQVSNTCTSLIVPVYVSHEERPSQEVMVYALLDTQSDTTFVLDSVCKDFLDMKPLSCCLRWLAWTFQCRLRRSKA